MNYHFSLENLEEYYNKYFAQDVADFFEIEKDGIGSIAFLPFHKSIRLPSERYLGELRKQKETEDSYYFVSLNIVLHIIQTIARRRIIGEEELIRSMNELGLPLFSNRLETNDIIKCAYICRTKDDDILREVVFLAEPFLINLLSAHFMAKPDLDKEKISKAMSYYVPKSIEDLLKNRFHLFRGYTGLTGTNQKLFRDTFHSYYDEKFHKQFRDYFDVSDTKGYPLVLEVFRRRWNEGMPGDNVAENLMFVAIFLYYIIAEQSINQNLPEKAWDMFHRCSGWPFISSGPGGGQYLHPLYMIEYAHLNPRKSEALLLLEAIDVVFPRMDNEFYGILNGAEGNMTNADAAESFLEEVRKGHNRTNIKRYMETTKVRIIELLKLWASAEEDTLYSFIQTKGEPIMIPYPNEP